VEGADRIRDEWFPVAVVDHHPPGTHIGFELLDERWVLAVGDDGDVLVAADTCPHRGARLSLGAVDEGRLVCPYHGWSFDFAGRCVHQPAHPDRNPPDADGLRPVAATARYGLWWVCVGDDPRPVPSFPALEGRAGPTLALAPAPVHSSGPRIVENFLDQAHFPFVHAGWLGAVPHTEVGRHHVEVVDGVLHVTGCSFWQPTPGPAATTGGPVDYAYAVAHPYAATLTKLPSAADGGDRGGFAILLAASPVHETSCRVFRVVAVNDPDVDPVAQAAFNQTIFEQDVPVVESQRPARLPLDLRAERHQPADAGSLGYRRWLTDRSITYGTESGG
jgi:phenylpropionate dioxygenase-like ring-hydroxylating dioxygenase large terminal subunit